MYEFACGNWVENYPKPPLAVPARSIYMIRDLGFHVARSRSGRAAWLPKILDDFCVFRCGLAAISEHHPTMAADGFPRGPVSDCAELRGHKVARRTLAAASWAPSHGPVTGRHVPLPRSAPPPGRFFLGLYGVVYGSFRIWLDTLHLQPMRFYGGAAAVIIGILAWIAMLAFERARKPDTIFFLKSNHQLTAKSLTQPPYIIGRLVRRGQSGREIIMSTLTKAEASRINGAKSRGPVTPEGKQRSSMNAVKHGLLAKSICLNIEKPEVFEELVAAFSTRLQPADEIEMRLVEQAALAQFRYERIAASTETAMFVLKMDNQAPEVAKQYERVDPPTRFAIAFTGLANEGNSIQLMLRYQQTMLRQRDSAIKQLHELRAKFPVPREPEAP